MKQIFPIYLWIGKRGENKIENYHFDVIDGVFYLNFVSNKSKEELGYDPIQPNGYMNINFNINKK